MDFAEEDADIPHAQLAFGSGLYGSFALFQIDNYFVEVYGRDLHHFGQPAFAAGYSETIKFFESNRNAFEAAGSGPAEEDG